MQNYQDGSGISQNDTEGPANEIHKVAAEVVVVEEGDATNIMTTSNTLNDVDATGVSGSHINNRNCCDERDNEIEYLKNRLVEAESEVLRLLKLSHDLCQYSTSLSRQVTTLRRDNRRLSRDRAMEMISDVEGKKWLKHHSETTIKNDAQTHLDSAAGDTRVNATLVDVEANLSNQSLFQAKEDSNKILLDEKNSRENMEEWNSRLHNFIERRKNLREESMLVCKNDEFSLAELSNAVKLKRSSMTVVDMEVTTSALSNGQSNNDNRVAASKSLTRADSSVLPFDDAKKKKQEKSSGEETAAHWKQKVNEMAQRLRESEMQKKRLMVQLSATTSSTAAATALLTKSDHQKHVDAENALSFSSSSSSSHCSRRASSVSLEKRSHDTKQFNDCSETVKRASAA